jgi:mono/diheme cytochrome c family protein
MPSRRLIPVLAAVCAVTAIAGCGGGSSGGGGGGGGGQSHARADRQGQELFAQACGACHTLSGHNDPRHQGGDLLSFHATRPQMLQLTGEMPVRHPLSRSQLDAVVNFVMAMEARSG